MPLQKYHESDLEDAVLEWLAGLGYSVAFGPALAPEGEAVERASYGDVVLAERLRAAVGRINPLVPVEAREDAVRKVIAVAQGTGGLLAVNQAFHRMLVLGVPVEYRREDGSIAGDAVWLVDFAHAENNDWLAVNQYTVIENNHNRRPDVVVLVNGLPLAVFELKNPADVSATNTGAFNQIQTYKAEIPSLFAYNELCIIADHVKDGRIGTISADKERFMGWKSVDGEARAKHNDLDVLIKGVFAHERFLDIIRNFIVFEQERDVKHDATKMIKKVAAYHQYFAVNKAVASTLRAAADVGAEMVRESPVAYGLPSVEDQLRGDKRAGVVWHTQGSGKSLSMVFYAGKMVQALDNPTLVVLTDRNDLDNQLHDTFLKCAELLRQQPKQAHDRAELRSLLTVASGGVVFTTIQKFMPEEKGDTHPMLTDRRNVIVIADEAHRSQYDFIDGFARHMHDALPNATFIGFTGTPIELSDKNTRAVFGGYVDVYDIAHAVEDKATVPIYYEARLAKIQMLKEKTPSIDAEFEELTEGEEVEKKERLKSKWARLEAMIGAPDRIELVARDIVTHFEARRDVMEGKGMIVAMSRRIAVELYDEIIKLRPQWHSDDLNKGFLKVVMTGAASDPAAYQKHIHTKDERDTLADRMKEPSDDLKLVIVRDMWLTGFDAPCLHTMYIDKPMQGHGLMQAIARVNRVYKDKPGGLVVDYLGIAPSLKNALAYYTQDNQESSPTINQEDAVSAMREKYEKTAAMYHGFDYMPYTHASKSGRAEMLGRAMDHILALEDGKKRYAQAVAELSQAFALAVPSEEALRIRDEVGFFQVVKACIAKFEETGGMGGPTTEDYDHAIRQIVAGAITSDEVISVFDAAGLKNPNIAVLSDEFLEEVRGLERKNVAFEVLKKLLNDEIRTMEKKFLVKSRSFAKMLEETITRYQNQTIEAAQVIMELVELAKKIRTEKERGADLNLTEDEVAFYDALCENESAIKELGDETLKTIAKELVVMLRRNTSIDWTLKESVQAKLRVLVKKLLNKYKYPPDKQEQATVIVLEQAGVLCKDWSGE